MLISETAVVFVFISHAQPYKRFEISSESVQPSNLKGRWSTADDVATVLLHLFLPSAAMSESPLKLRDLIHLVVF